MLTSAAISEVFEEVCRRYSQAVRDHDRTRGGMGSVERGEAALATRQAIEAEFKRCFRPIAIFDWDRVERAAKGDLGDLR
jgi:hypothetical protein